MQQFLLICLAATVPHAIPAPSIVNGRLEFLTGSRLSAVWISFSGGTIALTLVLLGLSGGIPRLPHGVQLAPDLLTGGLLGGVDVTAVITVALTIGPANVVAATILGQLSMALLLDHGGRRGIPEHPISGTRLLGVLLLIAGVGSGSVGRT